MDEAKFANDFEERHGWSPDIGYEVIEPKTKDHTYSSPLELDYKLVKNWAEENYVRKVLVCNCCEGLVVKDYTDNFLTADDIVISKEAVSQNTVGEYYLPIGELLQEIKDRAKYYAKG